MNAMTIPEYTSVSPSDHLTLPDDEVHVWRAALDQPAISLKKLTQTLSRDESMRADRFYFDRDRKRFIVGRGMLRNILSLYLRTEPRLLRFSYGAYGKPYLVGRAGEETIRFNLSHSHELALYGFTRGREIGVDLEYIHDVPEFDQIAARFFSESENAVLDTLPSNEKQEAFFNCWTRKEAYIKAIGNGLAHPLDQFDVSLAPGEPARLLKVDGDVQEAGRWSLKSLMPAPGYVAAIAIEGHDWRLQQWRWSDK